jgi:hypothetical protein
MGASGEAYIQKVDKDKFRPGVLREQGRPLPCNEVQRDGNGMGYEIYESI